MAVLPERAVVSLDGSIEDGFDIPRLETERR